LIGAGMNMVGSAMGGGGGGEKPWWMP
jgi:hypothetical protein